MDRRVIKQSIIAGIFFLILTSVGVLTFKKYVPIAPSPTPNPLSNILPLKILSSQLFPLANSNNDYDFLVKIYNQNINTGAVAATAEISFFDSNNTLIDKKFESIYILPGQTRYFVVTPINLAQSASRADIAITNIDWQKPNNLVSSGVQVVINNQSDFQFSQQTGIFGTVSGSLFNNSDFDLNIVDVVVVLLDSQGIPIAVNKTQIRTFLSRTNRGFTTTWFQPFDGEITNVIVEAHTNILDSNNLIPQQVDTPQPF